MVGIYYILGNWKSSDPANYYLIIIYLDKRKPKDGMVHRMGANVDRKQISVNRECMAWG